MCARVRTCAPAGACGRAEVGPRWGRLHQFSVVTVGGNVETGLSVTSSPTHNRVTRGLSPGGAKARAPSQLRGGGGEAHARVFAGRVEGAGPGRQLRGRPGGAWRGKRLETKRPRNGGGGGERGKWATLRALGRGEGTGAPTLPGACCEGGPSRAPRGRGSDIWTERGSSILSLGSGVEPSPIQLCKQEEEVSRPPLGEGREGWSSRRLRVGPRGAGCASLPGARRRNLLQQTGDRGCP